METANFSVVDYLVFSSSLLIALLIGLYQWYKSRGKDTKDFYMGGGEISVVPVSLSYMAGIISAVSVLGNSSEMYYYGSQLWMNNVGLVLGTAFVARILVPVVYPLRLLTIYEFLELRWGSSHMRKLATAYKLVDLVTYTGIALYAPSLAISAVTPIPVNVSIVAMGFICCAYASLGGAKAVVYTDTFQAAVLVAGVLMVIVKGCLEVGGERNVMTISRDHGRIEFLNLSPSLVERHTLLTTLIVGMQFAVNVGGVTQSQYQRWGSAPTITQSYLVVFLGTGLVIMAWSLTNYSGLVVFAVYAECDPLTQEYIDKPDQVLMHFVADKLGHLPGVMGLFVAAVYSAVLSSVSSSINAIAAMLWKDLLQPLKLFAEVKEEKAKKINIIISACTGLLGVLLGFGASTLGGLVQMTYALNGALGGPVSGIFLTAILCPWVKMWSVFVAALCSLSFSLWIAIGNFLYAGAPEMLPLSIAGCMENDTSTTDLTTATTTTATTTLLTTTSTEDPANEDEVFVLYRLSYCLFGMIGILSTLLLSTVFSCIFGFAEPPSVPVQTVNRTCLRFYCWVRGEAVPQHDQERTKEDVHFPDTRSVEGNSSEKAPPLKVENDAALVAKDPGRKRRRRGRGRSEGGGEDNPVTVDDSV